MTKRDKLRLLPLARDRFMEGIDLSAICQGLGIGSRNTLAGWIEEAKAAGDDWYAEREKLALQNPVAPVEAARRGLVWLLQQQERRRADDHYWDALSKADKIYRNMLGEYSDPKKILAGAHVFAGWLAPKLSDADRERFKRLAAEFSADLHGGRIKIE
jgi:transposase-like protein